MRLLLFNLLAYLVLTLPLLSLELVGELDVGLGLLVDHVCTSEYLPLEVCDLRVDLRSPPLRAVQELLSLRPLLLVLTHIDFIVILLRLTWCRFLGLLCREFFAPCSPKDGAEGRACGSRTAPGGRLSRSLRLLAFAPLGSGKLCDLASLVNGNAVEAMLDRPCSFGARGAVSAYVHLDARLLDSLFLLALLEELRLDASGGRLDSCVVELVEPLGLRGDWLVTLTPLVLARFLPSSQRPSCCFSILHHSRCLVIVRVVRHFHDDLLRPLLEGILLPRGKEGSKYAPC